MVYKNLEEEVNTRDPCSKYSAFVTHIFLNVDNEARIEPPIQVVWSLSGGAAIRIFVSFGASGCFRNSFNSLSP